MRNEYHLWNPKLLVAERVLSSAVDFMQYGNTKKMWNTVMNTWYVYNQTKHKVKDRDIKDNWWLNDKDECNDTSLK